MKDRAYEVYLDCNSVFEGSVGRFQLLLLTNDTEIVIVQGKGTDRYRGLNRKYFIPEWSVYVNRNGELVHKGEVKVVYKRKKDILNAEPKQFLGYSPFRTTGKVYLSLFDAVLKKVYPQRHLRKNVLVSRSLSVGSVHNNKLSQVKEFDYLGRNIVV